MVGRTGSEARCAEVMNRRDRKCVFCGERAAAETVQLSGLHAAHHANGNAKEEENKQALPVKSVKSGGG